MLRPDCDKCIWNESCKQADIDNNECTDFTNVQMMHGEDDDRMIDMAVESERDSYRAAFMEYINE